MSSASDQVATGASTVEEFGCIKCTIRPMRRQDIDQCLDIWRRVELTEAYVTVANALTVDPDGFYVAELENSGRILGMCSGTFTRSDTAFMGFYAVEPSYQHIGIGKRLWAKTLERLDASVNIGLYGVPSMSNKYKKAGFNLEDSIRMIIYESQPGEEMNLQLDTLKDVDDLFGCRLKILDKNIDEQMFKKLVEFDQGVQKFTRESLLKEAFSFDEVPLTFAVIKDHSKTRLCDHHHSSQVNCGDRKSSCCAKPSQECIIEDETLSTTIKGALSISTSNLGDIPLKSSSPIDIPSPTSSSQQTSHHDAAQCHSSSGAYDVIGYGSIRHDNTSGGMIGPIYADSSDVCEAILKNLMGRFELKPGNKFSVMALSSNKQACKILNKIGMIEIDQCTRMFTKFIPTASYSKIYYVHSPNFSLF